MTKTGEQHYRSKKMYLLLWQQAALLPWRRCCKQPTVVHATSLERRCYERLVILLPVVVRDGAMASEQGSPATPRGVHTRGGMLLRQGPNGFSGPERILRRRHAWATHGPGTDSPKVNSLILLQFVWIDNNSSSHGSSWLCHLGLSSFFMHD